MKILSIVIPAYNIELYVEQCLDSLIEDESILPYLDIVVVNDGSKDATVEKTAPYTVRYPDSIRIIDKENGGHGSVINSGIREANGRYLKILDGDDWVNNKGLKSLVEYLNNENVDADWVINPYEVVIDGTGEKQKKDFEGVPVKTNISFEFLNEKNIYVPMHSITVRTDLFRENKFQPIDEKIFYVDMEYILYPVPYVKKMIFLDEVVYQYRVGTEGQSINMTNMIKRRTMHTKVIDSLHTYYINHEFTNSQSAYYLSAYAILLGMHADILLSMSDIKPARSEMNEMIKKYTDIVSDRIKDKKLSLLIKTRCKMFGLLSLYCRKIRH